MTKRIVKNHTIHYNVQMICPSCNSSSTKVIETRQFPSGDKIRRRRSCQDCSYRFTTQETILNSYPDVIKKSGKKEPFDRSKLRNGLAAACQKRSIPKTTIDTLIQKTCKWALQSNTGPVKSSDIGLFVLKELQGVDRIASMRFASVHQSFSSLEEFITHMESTL